MFFLSILDGNWDYVKHVVGGISTNVTKSNAIPLLCSLLPPLAVPCRPMFRQQLSLLETQNLLSFPLCSFLHRLFRIYVQDPSVPVQPQPVNHSSLAQVMSCKCAYVAEMMTWSCLNRESLTHSFLSFSITPLYPGRAVMWPGWLSDFYFTVQWKPWDIWSAVPASPPLTGITSWGGCLFTERIWWAGKDIHSVKALKSLSGWVQIPLAFNKSSFWQFWTGFLGPGRFGPAGRDSDLLLWVIERRTLLKPPEWRSLGKEMSNSRGLELIDRNRKFLSFGTRFIQIKKMRGCKSHFHIFYWWKHL